MHQAKQKSPAASRGVAKTPERWWQWFLVYPAVATALLTAVPEWIDKTQAIVHDVKQESYRAALRENQLWRRNLSCASAPYAWYENPSMVRVDATICKSGDVFVRASAPGGEERFRWLALEDVVRASDNSFSLIPAAHAQTLPLNLVDGATRPEQEAKYQTRTVVCQAFANRRNLKRHVRTPDGCYDEVIDTFNGRLLRRKSVPCRPSC